MQFHLSVGGVYGEQSNMIESISSSDSGQVKVYRKNGNNEDIVLLIPRT